MKNITKMEISDNSDSDDSFHLSDKNGNSVNKSKLINDLINESFAQEKPAVKSPNKKTAPVNNNSEVQEIENESANEKTQQENSEKTTTKSQSVSSIFNVSDLTSDDEVYLFQCPENYTKKDLCNKSLDFTKTGHSISYNGDTYKVEILDSEQKFITLAVPEKGNNGSLVKLPFKGHIVFKKNVNTVPSELKDIKVSDSHKVVFPTNLKVRHPLLGAEWKAHIELANKINFNIKKSKKVKKEKKQESQERENKTSKAKHSLSETETPKKKKKKYD